MHRPGTGSEGLIRCSSLNLIATTDRYYSASQVALADPIPSYLFPLLHHYHRHLKAIEKKVLRNGAGQHEKDSPYRLRAVSRLQPSFSTRQATPCWTAPPPPQNYHTDAQYRGRACRGWKYGRGRHRDIGQRGTSRAGITFQTR